MEVEHEAIPAEFTQAEEQYNELATATVQDAETELNSLMVLQRLARSNSLDSCIESTLEQKRQKAKEQELLSKKLKKFRARKARVNLIMAGMSKQKMQDCLCTFEAQEKRRQERQKNGGQGQV